MTPVIENYRHLHGDDDVPTGLLALQEAEAATERGRLSSFTSNAGETICSGKHTEPRTSWWTSWPSG